MITFVILAFLGGAASAALLVSEWEIGRRVMPRWERAGWVLLGGFGCAVTVAAWWCT